MNFKSFGSELSVKMSQYLFEYCSNSLEMLSLFYHEKLFYEDYENVFNKMERLRIENCIVGNHAKLHVYFPKLQNLYLGINCCEDRTFIRFNFLSLKSLSIRANYFSENNVKMALKLNPQLVDLILTPENHTRIFEHIKGYLPQLQYLHLHHMPENVIKSIRKPIHFKNIEIFNLDNRSPIERLPFSFDKLKFLFIRGPLYLNAECLKSFKNMRHLLSIFIHDVHNLDDNIEKLFNLENVLSTVQEVCIGQFNIIPVDRVVEFLNKSKVFKKLTCIMTSYKQINNYVDELKAKLGSEWQINDRPLYRNFCIVKI